MLRRRFPFVLLAFLLHVASAGAQSLCEIEQLTDGTASHLAFQMMPTISRDGSRVAFGSVEDYLGTNVDNNWEAFLWTEGAALQQITETTGVFIGGGQPRISGLGDRVLLESEGDLEAGSNLDGSDEVFLWTEGAGFRQITMTLPGAFPGVKNLSSNGEQVVFEHSVDLVGQNPDISREVFTWDVATEVLGQLTDVLAPEEAEAPDTDASGSTVFFESNADLLTGNPEGNGEIFRFRSGVGVEAVTSAAAGDSQHPRSSDEGRSVTFVSSADLVGSNGDGNEEIFLWREGQGTIQVTDTLAPADHRAPVLSGDGHRLVFSSDADLTGENPDLGFEVFLFDPSDSWLMQLTDSPIGDSSLADIDRDGRHIVFRSEADLTGGNADGSAEIFRATCPLPRISVVEIPTISGIAALLLAGLLVAAAFRLLAS